MKIPLHSEQILVTQMFMSLGYYAQNFQNRSEIFCAFGAI